MLTPGETVSLDVEKPAVGGRMIARLDGRVVLVGGAIPGERVTARIDRVAKSLAYAETVAVDESSPDRRSVAADPLCGGCLYAHVAYPRQIALKALVVHDAFARIGQIALPSAVAVAPSPEEGYRMRARLHVRGGRIGFFREGTHDLCDARQTRQLLPATSDALDRVAAGLRSLRLDGIREIEVSENVDASERVVHLESTPPLDSRTLDRLTAGEGLTAGPYVADLLRIDGREIALRRHVLSFFQGNRFLLRDLVAHVVAQVPSGADVVDLYAGAGVFSTAAAVARSARVTAVEGDRYSAADLAANAAASGARLETIHAPVEAFVSRATPGAGTIVADPPRTGLSREALDGIIRLGGERVIYVSCDVATLARDARRLVDAGYDIEKIDAFDMFPNTPHVETVVVFVRGVRL
jgi:23S rRNA (uracil1939-C5)-methyltransferase